MFTRRNVALLSLGLCALIAVRPEGDFFKHLSARDVKESVFVSAGNRRLVGFFDGLTPDPHWNEVKERQAKRAVPQCGANSAGSLFGRLAALFERTAYAQVNCGTSICNGNWQQAVPQPCGTGCTIVQSVGSSNDFCDGTEIDGSNGCQGQACAYICNNSSCRTPDCGGGPGTGCVEPGSGCTEDGDCCSGSCMAGVVCGSVL